MSLRLNRPANALLLVSLLLSGCDKPEQREARYMKRGDELLAEGKLAQASVEYRNAARLNPTDANALYHLALVDDEEGNFRDAFKGFNAAAEQDSHFRPALLKIAEYYIAAGQFEPAMERIGTVLTDAPDDAQAHAVLSALDLKQGKQDEAEKEARNGLAKDVGNELATSVLASIYSLKGDLPSAIAIIESGIARNPHSLPLLLGRANLYEKADDATKLTQAYEAIFAVAPSETKYRLRLAAALLAAGKIDQTEQVLRDGIKAQPQDWELGHQLVLFLTHYRGPVAAEKEIRQSMADFPKQSEPQDWLVELYLSQNQSDQAVTFLNQVVGRGRNDTLGLAALTSLARIAYLKGDRDTAAKLADEVLNKQPSNLDAQFVKAHLEVDAGSYRQAVADLRNILRDKPGAREALSLLSEALLRQGHPDLAIETLNQLIDQDPLNIAGRIRLAQLYAANNDPHHAMDLLFLVTKTDPTYPIAWENTARIAMQLQDWGTATAAIDRLDKLPGQHMLALLLHGTLLAEIGRKDEAITALKQVIEADPTSLLAAHAAPVLVAIYRDEDKLSDATHYLEAVKNPSSALLTLLGQCLIAQGAFDQAATAFDRAIDTHPATQEPFLNRAKLYLRAGQTDAALSTLKTGASAVPADIRIIVAEAQLLEQLNRLPEAENLYRQQLARNAEDDIAANNLADLITNHNYNDTDKLEEARQLAERFVASGNPLLLDTLAWVYYRQNRPSDALAVMERTMQAAGDTTLPPEIHYHYGAILLASDRRGDARKELQQATATNNASYPGLKDAAQLLAGLGNKP